MSELISPMPTSEIFLKRNATLIGDHFCSYGEPRCTYSNGSVLSYRISLARKLLDPSNILDLCLPSTFESDEHIGTADRGTNARVNFTKLPSHRRSNPVWRPNNHPMRSSIGLDTCNPAARTLAIPHRDAYREALFFSCNYPGLIGPSVCM